MILKNMKVIYVHDGKVISKEEAIRVVDEILNRKYPKGKEKC